MAGVCPSGAPRRALAIYNDSEVTVAGDRRTATVELCSGCGDDGEHTIETVELRFDGSRIIERRVP